MLSRQDECRWKHRAVVQYLESRGLEAVILTRRCNFAWFTGGGLNHVSTGSDVGAASLLVTREGALCITNNIEGPRVSAEDLEGLGIELRSHFWWDSAEAARLWLAELGGRSAAADAAAEGLPAGVQPLGADFDRIRWQLDDGDVERYRKLAPEVGLALEMACKAVRPGMTEDELAARIAAELRERAIRGPVILVANEERVRRFRHPLPTAAKFSKYGMGVCVGERDGLHVSATRLFTFGPIDEDLRRRHVAVNAVDAAMMAATRPDRTLGEIFDVCRKAYADGGFAEDWKLHHQGGLCGYQARENRATPGSSIRVTANQVYGWNPSITGTKSEDTILVLPDRTEIISATGQWPTNPYAAGGLTFERNEILRL